MLFGLVVIFARNEALSPAMSIPDWLGHGYGKVAENAPQILARELLWDGKDHLSAI